MKGFEERFNAVTTKLNAISQTTKLPEFVTSLLLLANAKVSDTQRVTVLPTADPKNRKIGASAPNDQFLQACHTMPYHLFRNSAILWFNPEIKGSIPSAQMLIVHIINAQDKTETIVGRSKTCPKIRKMQSWGRASVASAANMVTSSVTIRVMELWFKDASLMMIRPITLNLL